MAQAFYEQDVIPATQQMVSKHVTSRVN